MSTPSGHGGTVFPRLENKEELVRGIRTHDLTRITRFNIIH